MASLDLARMQMATEGRKLLGKAIELAEEARARINRIAGVRCLGAGQVEAWGGFRLDVTKLTISVRTGRRARGSEHRVRHPVEMADLYNVLIIGIGDRRDDLRPSRRKPACPRVGPRRWAAILPCAGAGDGAACRPGGLFRPHTYRCPRWPAASADIVTIYLPGI
jgi:hypothetical protein